MKHIEYSQGHYFIEDLQEEKAMQFTYNFKDQLKIDIDKAREEKKQKE